MTRRLVGFAVVIVTLWSASLAAELKVTSRTTMKKVAASEPADEVMAAAAEAAGPMIEKLFGGPDGIEAVVTVHEDGRARVEYRQGVGSLLPAGTVMLGRTDGTWVGYDAKAGTWWKMPVGPTDPATAALMAQMNPDVSVTRTGESATIAGLKGERVRMSVRLPVPLPAGVEQMPPEMLEKIPRELGFDADVWQTSDFARYTKAIAAQWTTGPMAQFNMGRAAAELQGLTLRSLMRMSMLPGYELEMVVTDVREESAPDGTFDLPAGLKEVPMPVPGIR